VLTVVCGYIRVDNQREGSSLVLEIGDQVTRERTEPSHIGAV
jgi:hypothetical protein